MGTAASVISLLLALLLIWKGRASKIAAVLALLAGTGLAAGVVGGMFQTGLGWLSSMVGAVTAAAFGAAVPAILFIVALFIVLHDLWPKHPANRTTATAAVALPSLALGVGGAAAAMTTRVADSIGSGAGSAFANLFGVG